MHARCGFKAVSILRRSGRMMMQMVGAFAEFERAMLRERTQAGFEFRPSGRMRSEFVLHLCVTSHSLLAGMSSVAPPQKMHPPKKVPDFCLVSRSHQRRKCSKPNTVAAFTNGRGLAASRVGENFELRTRVSDNTREAPSPFTPLLFETGIFRRLMRPHQRLKKSEQVTGAYA